MAEPANFFDKAEASLEKSFAGVKQHAHWLPRIGLAGVFLYHGVSKLQGGAPPQAGLDMMFLGSSLVFWLVALGETFAGAAILAGGALKSNMGSLLTREAGGIIAIIMLGAIFIVHAENGWNFMEGGAEFQTMAALLGGYFLLRGNN